MESVIYSSNALAIIASIAIAIAGFSGVVVALTGKTTAHFSPIERLNLRILLQVSALALFFSVLPLILHRVFEPELAWRTAMFLYGAIHLADAGFYALRTLSSEAWSQRLKVAPFVGTGIAVSQLLIAWFGSSVTVEVVYLFVLIWHLAIAGMGFANLVFSSRD